MRDADRFSNRPEAAAHGRAPGRARAGAFTLIEVVVALVVVSLGMLGVIQAVGQTASNSAYLREKTLAHWVAMNRLTEVRLQKSAPKVDKSSDDVEMGGRRWHWTMNVTQSQVESIRRIDISVRAADGDADSTLAFVTGFYGSAIAPPGSTTIDWQGSENGPGGGVDADGDGKEDGPGSDKIPGGEPPLDDNPPFEEPPPIEEPPPTGDE